MKKWMLLLACVACFVVGFSVGTAWLLGRELVSPPPPAPHYDPLPQRPFDRSGWFGPFPDHARLVQARGAMRDSVVSRFKPGLSLAAIIDELGCPDRIDLRRDTRPSEAIRSDFGARGTMILQYDAGWIPSGPGDWYPADIGFVFSSDAKLVRVVE